MGNFKNYVLESPSSYRSHPDLVWSVESTGLLIICRDTRTWRRLGYPDAALWDLLSRETPVERVIRIMAIITDIDREKVSAWINDTIYLWEKEGWIIKGRGDV